MATPKEGVVYTRTALNSVWSAPGRGELVPDIVAGSLPVGAAEYEIPQSNVLYVAPSGNNSNPGTVNSPKATLAGAVSAASNGYTIVLREGTYHESTNISKQLTVQNYPGEEVWFDGSSVYSNWTGSGPWTTTLGFSWTPIDSSRYSQTGDGLAHYPEQVWVDGVAQKQIADNATPAAGQFSVNRTNGTLTLGTNPSGKEVRIADLRVWSVVTADCLFRGFGVRRFSPAAVEGVDSSFIYIAGNAYNAALENMEFRDSGMHAISVIRPVTIDRVTVANCNNAGIQVTTADGAVIKNFLIEDYNLGDWQREPITAGIKVTRTDNILIQNGLVSTPKSSLGVWFDVSCTRFVVANVTVEGTDTSFEAELSGGGFYDGVQHHSWFVNCRTRNPADWSMKIFDSDYVTVANCDLAGGRVALNFQQDERFNDNQANNKTFQIVPWVSGHCRMWNNKIISQPSTASMIAYHDPATAVPNPAGGGNIVLLGWDFFDEIAGNWVPTAPPGSMIQLGQATGARSNYNTWALAASSPSSVGGPPGTKLGTNHQGSDAPSDSIAKPLPDDIADILGIPHGTQRVGTIVPEPVPAT